MEHLDGILYKNVFIAILEAFHSVAVFVVAYSTFVVSISVVAVCYDFCCLIIGVHGIAFNCKCKIGYAKEPKLFLFVSNIFCPPSVVWVGQFSGNIEIAIYKTLQSSLI